MTKEAIKQALEVFGGCNWHDEIVDSDWADKAQSAIKALEEALKQEQGKQLARLGWQEIDCPICGGGARAFPKQEQGEPVGKFAKFTDDIWREVTDRSAGVFLYTHPKEWVGLTNEEIEDCFDESCHLKVVDPKGGIKGSVNIFEVGKAIENKLKERNT